MNLNYTLEFRSIDPARRFCESNSCEQKLVRGFNAIGLANAGQNISEDERKFLLQDLETEGSKLNFIIEPYQRGFRWDAKDNVRKLLEDLFAYSESKGKDFFSKTSLNSSKSFDDKFDFYCLQTLTVKDLGSKSWEVIDGQQRLTCIFLIYTVLSSFCGPVTCPYDITYRREEIELSLSNRIYNYIKSVSGGEIPTRDILLTSELTEESKKQWFEQFAADVKDKFVNEDNFGGSYVIDSYYIRTAIEEILDFVCDGKEIDQINCLLNCIKRNVYFLWYVVPESNELSSVDVFMKINSGAIPLTNAELIKSLVLRSDNQNIQQKSYQWEEIERGLGENELWAFISGEYKTDTRIDLLLDVYARKEKGDDATCKDTSSNNPYALFDWYNAYSKKTPDFSDRILKGIRDIFDRTKEWYDDVEIYHYIGLLTLYQKLGFRYNRNYKSQQQMLSDSLLEAEKVPSKKDFVQKLKNYVLLCLKDDLKNKPQPEHIYLLIEDSDKYNNDFLTYSDEKKRIEAILWLFNVYETNESADNKKQSKYKKYICRRFPFSEALSGSWSLEHIFPQHPDEADEKEKKQYEQYVEKLADNCLLEDDIHYIKNLALLKKDLNTSLQNDTLYKKRERLIQEIGNGAFVPCATVNAFMLYYNIKYLPDAQNSSEIDHNWRYWTVKDADAYQRAIVACLKDMEGV